MPRGKHNGHLRAARHPRWQHGRLVNAEGYVLVRVGIEHPLADPNGYAYEHLVVWIAAGRARPGPSDLLHHRNDDKTDNRIENLELVTRARHNAIHLLSRQRDAQGRFLPVAVPKAQLEVAR